MNNTKEKLYKRAFSSITVIVLLSLLTSAFILSVANDLYAFVKPDANAELTVSAPTSIDKLSLEMQKMGIIQNPHIFLAYVYLKGMTEEIEDFRGSVKLSSDMSYREIVGEFIK